MEPASRLLGADPDLDILQSLAGEVVHFSTIFFLLSIIAALAVQALHEGLRYWGNRWVFRRWLGHRNTRVDYHEFMEHMGSISSGALFSLPYWQLTGQINATLATKMETDPSSNIVSAFANLPMEAVGDKHEQTRRFELISRVQNGVQSLHSRLRSFWRVFDYAASLYVILAMMLLIDRGPRSVARSHFDNLILFASIGFFAWLAAPLVRRIIERFVPFR